jgi:hypothetical protein
VIPADEFREAPLELADSLAIEEVAFVQRLADAGDDPILDPSACRPQIDERDAQAFQRAVLGMTPQSNP